MVVNQDGEEVNSDGTPITDEQKETHDWTEVIELHNKSKLKPYSIDELATKSVPHTIPYLEVFRTDELFYEEYTSPFSSDISTDGGSSDGSGSDDSSSSGGDGTSVRDSIATIVKNHITVSQGKEDQYIDRLVNADTNWSAIAKIVNGHKIFGKGTQNSVIQAILDAKRSASSSSPSSGGVSPNHSTLKNNKRLSNELKRIVKKYYKKGANHTTLVNRYMNCKTNRESIGSVTNHSSVWLKVSISPSTVNDAVYRVKHKYS